MRCYYRMSLAHELHGSKKANNITDCMCTVEVSSKLGCIKLFPPKGQDKGGLNHGLIFKIPYLIDITALLSLYSTTSLTKKV